MMRNDNQHTSTAETAAPDLGELLDYLPGAILVIGKDRKIQYASQAAERITGMSVASIVGHSCHSIYGKDQECNACVADKSFETGKMVIDAHSFTNHRDREVRVEQFCFPIKSQAGVERVVAYVEETDVRGVFGRETKVLALAQLRRLLQQIADSIGSSIIIMDHFLNVQYVNNAYCRIYDVSREKVIGKNVAEVIPEPLLSQEPRLLDAIGETLHTGNPTKINGVRHCPSNQECKILSIGITSISIGENPQLYMAIDDVTDRERKSYQLEMLREIGRTMQGTLELGKLLHLILTCVTAGFALGFNRAFLLMRDQKEDTLVGRMAVGPSSAEEAGQIWQDVSLTHKTLKDFLVEYDHAPEREDVSLQELVQQMQFFLTDASEPPVAALLGKEPVLVSETSESSGSRSRFEEIIGVHQFVCVPLIAKDRAIGVVVADNLYSGKRISEDDVEILGIFASQAALVIDNTTAYRDLKDKIEKLHDAQRQIISSEKLATVGEMAAHVAHEIRNPLVTIGGFARSLLRSTHGDPRVETDLKIIVEEVCRLENMLSNVMDFTKPSKPMVRLQNINDVVKNTLALMEDKLQKTGIELVLSLSDSIPDTLFDPQQMKQVVLNIAQNAIDSMSGKGKLEVCSRLNGDFVYVEIKDTGRGIPAKNLSQIFDPFFSAKSGGAGLGLAVSKKIIDDHGGLLDVKSNEGYGTTFTISLPKKAQQTDKKEVIL